AALWRDVREAITLPTSLPSVARAPGAVRERGEAMRRDNDPGAAMAVLQITPADVVIQRLEAVCTEEAMVRLRLEGPLTRDQYRALDVRRIWLYGQHHAFSFEVDESGLFLALEGSHDVIGRGERV